MLYNNNEISLLLTKKVRERDALVAKKKARHRNCAQKEVEGGADVDEGRGAASDTVSVE